MSMSSPSKILIINTNVFPVPLSGYGGIEQLVYLLSEGLSSRGWKISVVSAEGSKFSNSLEFISAPVNENEEQTYNRYKGRLENNDWDLIIDSSWQRWSSMINLNRTNQLPIINWHHTHPSVYQSSIPVRYNMWVGLSRSHADDLSKHFQLPVRFIHNGIDVNYYKDILPTNKRTDAFLWVARWTVEKDPMSVIELAKKLRIRVDMYGDDKIIRDRKFRDHCFNEADGIFARANPGIPRNKCVDEYSSHRALIQMYNWGEPFGLNIVEAMSCGCVPIVQRRGAAEELIINGVTGFLVDNIDQVKEIISEKSYERIQSSSMREHVVKNFSVDKFIDHWEELINKVLMGERW